jgi:3-oxoacyl-[acyl-carrier protein] reductase
VQLSLDFSSTESVDNCINDIDQPLDGVVFIIPRISATTNFFPQDEEWHTLFDHYFIKPLRLLRKLYEQQLYATGCKIVCVSGISSKQALTNYAMNNCLRSAWLGQIKSLALGLAKDKVILNTLSMGGVLTENYINKLEQKAASLDMEYNALMLQEVDNIPLGAYATVAQVSGAIASLLGAISDHMTGQNIILDGGFIRAY